MKRLLACLLCLLASSTALAEGPAGGLTLDPAALGARHAQVDPSTTQVPARPPRMPAVLAASSGDRRAEMTRTYTQLLAIVEQAMDKQGLPRNDVAVAAALYLTGAYAAYRGSQVSDAGFLAMVSQLRGVLAATSSFTAAPIAQRQDMYEGLAIIGALMASAASTRPGDAAVRAAARGYLEAVIGSGAVDTMQITDRGLVVAAAPVTRDPAPAPTPDRAPASGHAFPSSRIAAILWTHELRYQPLQGGMGFDEDFYLLLTDGSCTDRPPRQLEDFEPARLRAEQPKRWGRWRKARASYEVVFGGSPVRLPGLTVLRGGKPGERLAGVWARQSSGSIGTASTWQSRTLTFTADGRFDLGVAGAFSSSTDVNRPPSEVVVSGAYDDDGMVGSVSGPNVGGAVRSRSHKTAADRSGTYSLDGFTLELRFDNGKVERHLAALSTDRERTFLLFGAQVLIKK